MLKEIMKIFNFLLLSHCPILCVGVDSVGTVSASLVTYASIQALQPDLIINAGTAGGFKVWFMCPVIFFQLFLFFQNLKASWSLF